jgi:hypothetical protein
VSVWEHHNFLLAFLVDGLLIEANDAYLYLCLRSLCSKLYCAFVCCVVRKYIYVFVVMLITNIPISIIIHCY